MPDSSSLRRKDRLTSGVLAFLIVASLCVIPATVFGAEDDKSQNKKGVRMTLADAVFVSLNNNVALKGAYLDRTLQKFDLRKAEDKFNPQSSMTLTAGRTSTYVSPGVRTDAFNSGGNYTATLTIPTGGNFNFTWANAGNRAELGRDPAYTSAWSLTFSQPLLKGGGIDNATYSVKVAQISEEQNILTLKDTISSTIKAAITAYRNYLSAKRQQEISNQSLAEARRTYTINEALITAGRKAKMELVETEANIANRELDAMRVRNSLESARLFLIQALNIEKDTQFDLVEESEYRISPPALQEAINIARENRTDYQKALKNIEIRKWDLSNAKWNRMWTLSLDAGTTDGEAAVNYSAYRDAVERTVGSGAQRNWNVGLTLVVPFSMLTDEQRTYLSARNELNKAAMNLKKMEMDIEIAVQNAVRDVETNYRQMELAKQARALSEKKLEVEDEKLKVGRTTNFQLVSYQNDLNNAKVNELNAIMNYLNSLTTLDDTLGTTLATWNINVSKEDEKVKLPDTAGKPK